VKGERDPEPLPTALRALLAPEREAAKAPAPGKARVRARLDATLFGPGGGGAGGGGGGAGPLARTAGVFLAGAVAGGAVVYALVPTRVVERVVERAPVVAAVGPGTTAPVEPATVAVPVATHPMESASAAAASPSASASASASAMPPTDSLAQERAILDPARVAIGRGDGSSALDAVRRHEARFPDGKLAEEREAIAVQALVLAHQNDAARARGERFVARHPGSVLRPAVEAALAAARP
jgi:hypothetical protein